MKNNFHKRIFSGVFGLLLFALCVEAQLPKGESLLPDGLKSFTVFGTDAPNSLVHEVPVGGQPFSTALRVDTYTQATGRGNCGLTANIKTNLHRGDVLWISFKSRSLASKRETGESFVEVRFDQLVDGKYKWPAHVERGVSFGSEWTETTFPFVMQQNVEPKDVRLVFQFDTYAERFELGPVTFINYGQNVKMSDLPRSVARYDGGEPDAPWRKQAAAGIEKYRKGDLTVKVLDTKGKPVKDADVSIKMKRNAFHWGAAVSSLLILDSTSNASQCYRDTLAKYFNQAVFDMEMKWGTWIGRDSTKRGERTKESIKWLTGKGLAVRGHVMVWPSWQNAPRFLEKFKNDTASLSDAILKHIHEQTTVMRGKFSEWDVVNEPIANNDFLKMLGWKAMVRWFKAARAGDPEVKLFLNDYTMFQGKGKGSKSQEFYDNIKLLIDNGAPIDAIGEQGHIGGTPPAISDVLERLDYFAKFGLPIQISEFDINNNDDDLKARYMRDFMTAIYSHPATIGFVQWGFWEGHHWFPVAALWNRDWTLRQNGKVYTELVTKTWWTNFDGKTNANGTTSVRGFTGDYEITVNYKDKTIVKNVTLGNKGGNFVIVLK